MSRLATEYLQKSVSLPRQVTSIETDLSNGYLFVSLMKQFGHVSEEEYEEAMDLPDPDAVLKNFRLLARSLRRLDISLTRKDVANIVSETPGSSAQLVMQIRKAQEAKMEGIQLNAPPAFKEVLKSARPKEFTRKPAVQEVTSIDDAFLTDARSVLKNGVFAELDMRCHVQDFYKTRFENTKKGTLQNELAQRSKLDQRKLKHDTIATTRKLTRERNHALDEDITQRWITTEEDKRKRQVRDLQFELATIKIDDLRRRKRSATHKADQIKGIDAFEVNLKRSGIGGGDEGGNLSITYEDSELFAQRLVDMASASGPTDDETGDFMNQLKIRTRENYVARYEKDRRRRRMLVEQAAVNNSFTSVEEDGEASTTDAGSSEQEIKAKIKAERIQKMVEDGAKSRAATMEIAEENISKLSETFSSRAEEIDAERREKLKNILEAREKFEKERAEENRGIVRSIVLDFVGDIFDADSDSKDEKESLSESDPNMLVGQLLDAAVSRCIHGKPLSGITSLDSWSSHAALAMNLGKWQRQQASFPNVPAAATDEVEEADLVERSSDENIAAVATTQIPSKAIRQDSFLETAQTVLETIVQRSREASSGGGNIPLDLSSAQAECISATDSKIVVVLSCGFSPTLESWRKLVSYTAGKSGLWDMTNATMMGMQLKPLMEGKKPTVNFSSLVSICTEGKLECPEALAGTALPPDVIKACNEIVVAAGKVLSLKDKAESDTGLSAGDVAFNPVSCAVAIGQSLWLRKFIRDQLVDVADIDTALPKLLFVSRFFGSACSFDDAVLARIVDHFYNGGSVDDVPDTEVEFNDAMAANGMAGKGKKPAKKGKGEPEVSEPRVAIAAVAWIHSPVTAAFNTSVPDLQKPVLQDGQEEDFLGVDQVRYYLNCADVARLNEAVPENTLLKSEAFLLRYGVAAVPEGVEAPKAGDVIAKIPIYSMENPNAIAKSAEEVIPDENVDEAPAKVLVASALTSQLVVSKELSCTETLLSLICDVYNFHYNFVAPERESAPAAAEKKESHAERQVTGEDDEPAESEPVLEVLGSVHAIELSHNRVRHITTSRRVALKPEDNVWLLHLVGEHDLAMEEIFDIHDLIARSRSIEIELKGLLIMIISFAMVCIEEEARRQETHFIGTLKTSDQRWFSLCAETINILRACDPEKEDVVYEDLVCTIGNIIDDRHMKWLSSLTAMESSGSNAILDLQKVLLDVTELFARASFEILDAQKEASNALSRWLEKARYTRVPWLPDEGLQLTESDSVASLRDALSGLKSTTVTTDGSDRSRADALWGDILNMELPVAVDVGNIEALSLRQLYKEMTQSCYSVVHGSTVFIQQARELMLTSLNQMKANTKRRYSYEHEVLGDWGSQLRGYDPKPDSVSGKQFLQQFHFGVSDDAVNDQVPFVSGKNQVEVGDMQIDLQILHILVDEIATPTGSDGDANTSSGAAAAATSVADAVCGILCAAVKRAVQRGQVIPRPWRSLKRVQNFVNKFTASLSVDSTDIAVAESAKIVIRDLVSHLLHAATPIPPTIDFITRTAKVLCKSAPDSDLLMIGEDNEPMTTEMLVKRVLADSKLAVGWWDLGPTADLSMEAIIKCYLSIICNTCLNAAGDVMMIDFFLTLCKCPSFHNAMSVEEALCFSNSSKATQADSSMQILNPGLYKAMSLASKISVPSTQRVTDTPASPRAVVRTSEGNNKLDQLLGKSVLLEQANWLSNASSGTAISPIASIFRARIAQSQALKADPASVEAKSAQSTAQSATPEECESEESKEEQVVSAEAESEVEANEKEAEAWTTIDTQPSGVSLPIAMAWYLETSSQIRGADFSCSRSVDRS